jgi:hypothetical protein
MRTAHRVSLQVPGVRGPYQDISPWGSAFDAALRAFDAGKTLYYYDCDPARAGDAKCRVSDVDPALANPRHPRSGWARASLRPDAASKAAEPRNRAAAAAPASVALTTVALGRQQYIAHTGCGGSYVFALPLQ